MKVNYVSWWITGTFEGMLTLVWLCFKSNGVTKEEVEEDKENWGKEGAYDFDVQDEDTLQIWVDAVVDAINNPLTKEQEDEQREDMKQWFFCI